MLHKKQKKLLNFVLAYLKFLIQEGYSKKESKGYKTFSRKDLVLLNNTENFANSPVIFDDIVDDKKYQQ